MHSTPTTERLDIKSGGGRPCDYEKGNYDWKDECSRAVLEGIHSIHGRQTCDAVFILTRLRWLHHLLVQDLGVTLSLSGYLEQLALSTGMGRSGYNEKIKHVVSYVSSGTILPLTVHNGSLA